MGDDLSTTLLVEDLRQRGVRLAVLRDAAMNNAGFVALLTSRGVQATVSSLPQAHRVIAQERIVQALEGVSGVIADATHSPASLSLLTQICQDRVLPCWIAGVSPERILATAGIDPPPTAWVLNAREAHALWCLHQNQGVRDYPGVALCMGCPLIVLRPTVGVAYVTTTRVRLFPHPFYAGAGQRIGSRAHVLAQGLRVFLRHADMELAIHAALNTADPVIETATVLHMAGPARDPLTGLHRRDALVSALQEALDERAWEPYPLTVFFLDLNRFKVLNDQRGHIFGDAVLAAVAQTIQEVLPTGWWARWGGDEFAGFIRTDRVRWVRDCLRGLQSVTVSGESVPIGATVGAVLVRAHDCPTAIEAIHAADQHMYRQRNNKRRRA